ncbi:MAG: hypothetical protein DIU60_001840 [Actinomycetes bacterium]
MSDRRIRLDYLDEVLAALFPVAPGDAPRPYTLLPHRLVPRRLVPREPYHRLLGRAVPVPAGDGGIEAHLRRVLGREVRVALLVRPARRANRKPVLEVREAGRRIAYVKVADTDRVRGLVRHEAAVLRMLETVPTEVVVAPRVLHHGVWRGMDVLVLSALPVPRLRRAPSAALRTAAIREIGGLAAYARWRMWYGGAEPGHPAASRAAPAPAVAATAGTALGTAADTVLGTAAGTLTGTPAGTLPRPAPGTRPGAPGGGPLAADGVPGPPPDAAAAGDGWAWHGDFSPWNIAPGPRGRLLVWDWERFAVGVPPGFDALHHFLHRTLRRAGPARAARMCLERAPRLLAPFGVADADAARRTAARYLVALADRHRRDGHEPFGPPAAWLTPLLEVPS